MRSVYFHLVLLGAGLFAAWSIWTRDEAGAAPPAAEDEGEVVFDISPQSIEELSFEGERRKVKIVASGNSDDRSYDVSTYRRDERRRPPPAKRPATSADGAVAADGGGADAGPSEPRDAGPPPVEVVETRKRFTGNKALTDYIAKVAPLKAKRNFGVVRQRALAEFELDEPRGTIVIRSRGRTITLKVGGTPFGSTDAYVMDARTSRVYLVAAAIVRDLEFAESRFMQRELAGLERKEIAKVVITRGERRKVLLQQGRNEQSGAHWTDQDRSRNELYDNWMRRLLDLRAIEYLEPGTEPSGSGASAAPSPVVTVELFDERRPRGRIEIVQIEGDRAEYFARSRATRGWVKLSSSSADLVERDLDGLLQ